MDQQKNRIRFRKTLYFRMIEVIILLGIIFFAALFCIYRSSYSRFQAELSYQSDKLTEQICRNVEVSLKELSEKTVPLTDTNGRLGAILAAVPEKRTDYRPPYLNLRIRKEIEELLSMNYDVDWMAVVDLGKNIHLVNRDARIRGSMPTKSEVTTLYLANEKDLTDKSGNITWVSGSTNESIILMRQIFDYDTMRFCGSIIAGIRTDVIKEIFSQSDSGRVGDFTLYDKKGIPIFSTYSSDSEAVVDRDQRILKSGRTEEILRNEYPINRGKLTLVHLIDMGEKNRPFLELLRIIEIIGLLVFLIVIVFLWLMFGRMARDLKILTGNLHRISKGDFQLAQVKCSKADELGILASDVEEMAERIQALMAQVVKNKEIQEQNRYKLLEMRYHELQSQVNPHFLFNILQSINGIAQINGDVKVSKLICMLSKFFRGNIDRHYTSCELCEELEYARNYMELYKSIYPKRLKTIWDVDESLLHVRVPSYILQPIVENSMVHGMEPMIELCTVKISVKKENDKLKIIVWDDGAGIEPERCKALLDKNIQSKRVGLENVQDRIQILHGEEHGISIKSEYGKYTEVTILLPLSEDEEEGV